MKIVVLAGGKGTRLGLVDRPKPMVLVSGRPLLERLVEVGKRSGFTDFVFLNGHKAEVIEDYFGDGSRFGVHIEHVREPTALGTAGAVRDARSLLTAPFIVLYGDILIEVDLAHFADFHRKHGGIGTVFVHPNDHPHDSDIVEVGENDRIARLLPKPHPAGAILPNLVSAALYVLAPQAIDFVPETGSSDWVHDVFPQIIANGHPMFAYRSVEYAKDLGTPERLAKGEADIASGRTARLSHRNAKPAIFLDRDGVLNAEINGVHRSGDLILTEDAGSAVRTINKAGIPAICVTNQPDIAKGMMSIEDFGAVSAMLDTRLAEAGAFLDDLFFCPHHPENGWPGEVAALKIECDCRKPAPGMLLAAAQRHNLDLSKSWLIGDRYADVAAAHAAGARAILVQTGHGGSDSSRYAETPDHVADTLTDAVDHALKAIA
jgi:mannose-1-phosphate guanylyltransferase/phosphomannomutase